MLWVREEDSSMGSRAYHLDSDAGFASSWECELGKVMESGRASASLSVKWGYGNYQPHRVRVKA